jgi:biotin carboxylase
MSLSWSVQGFPFNRQMSENRIVVVGTTPDYIDEIRRCYPRRALFVTDPSERAKAREAAPEPWEELLCDLKHAERVIDALNAHRRRWQIRPVGVACYDCESLQLTARIAQNLELAFPSPAAVAACRNKLISKRIWRKAELPCPEAEIIRNPSDAIKFMQRQSRAVILKPLTGSGSELVFKCSDSCDLTRDFETLKSRLSEHPNLRMYSRKNGSSEMDSRREFVIETFIEGREYSCDCIVDGKRLVIIRTAEKLAAPAQPPGTTMAYLVPAGLPLQLDQNQFKRRLHTAARALGLEHSVFMVDFIVEGTTAYLLEITPRPGGDCLPWLIRESCGLDMLGLALDFAEGKPILVPEASHWKPLVGMRFLAKSAGVVKSVDDRRLQNGKNIKARYLKVQPGYRVTLPPEDYDSRILGHVIFEPDPSHSILEQCLEHENKLRIEMVTDP